jgi:hypothetical protein
VTQSGLARATSRKPVTVVAGSPPMSESTRWPEFAATAARVSRAGLAKIPTRLDNQIIVAFNLYSTEPRQWSDEAIAVARVLATSYMLNASKLRQQEQLSEKLQKALDSRLIIEQAKRKPPNSVRSRSIRPASASAGSQ